MGYTENFNQLFHEIKKSVDENGKLSYFKRKLMEVLNNREDQENRISKAIDDYCESISKSLFNEYGIEKGRVGTIGEIRTWKDGKKYKKMPNGKWVRVYQHQDRSAEISIARLKGKIAKASSIDELMQLVTANIHRFEDENGQVLDIVKELQEAVKGSKTKLNAGKPSTQEQIEKYKKEHEETSISKKLSSEIKELEAEYQKIISIDINSTDYEGLKRISDKGNSILDRLNENIRKTDKDRDYAECSELEDIKSDFFSTLSRINWRMNTVERNYRKEKFTQSIKDADTSNLTEKDWQGIKRFQQTVDDFIAEKEQTSWNLQDSVITFTKNISDSESCKKWMKLQGINNFDDFYEYVTTKISENIKAKKRAESERQKVARNEKINEINKNNAKTFTDDEITKALKDIIPLTEEKNELFTQLKEIKRLEIENKNAQNKRNLEINQLNYEKRNRGEPIISIWNDEEYNELRNKSSEIWRNEKSVREKVKIMEEKMDKIMDPIAYYYLNDFKYEKDESVNNCKTTNEVIDLMKSKDWYSDIGKNRMELQSVDVEAAKDIFRVLERMFAIFPEQKGQNFSVRTNYSNSTTWATGGTAITFNRKYWKNYAELNEGYKLTEGSYHPMGTTAKDIIYHEYYHVMTVGRIASRIKENVTKNLKMRGKKGGPKIKEIIQFGVSEYALKNADEFGAECFCQALGSKNPTAFAKEVFKETLKYKKYMRGLV